MNPPAATASTTQLWAERWQRFSRAALQGFHAYANWLVSISWRRFIVLSLLLLIVVGIVHDLPPFTWTFTERIESSEPRRVDSPRPPRPPVAARAPTPPRPVSPDRTEGVDISIGPDGIRIVPRAAKSAASAASAASGESAASATAGGDTASADRGGVQITLPPGANEAVRAAVDQALREAQREIEQAMREAQQDIEEARRETEAASRDAEAARHDAEVAASALSDLEQRTVRRGTRTTRIGIGDLLMQLSVLWVLASTIIKITYKGRMQAEVKAARATETAEAESLKRQVVEARMAAMQAQVEPHFLFNTLASIDHLIETDPPRASQMQKNLIALLRASMPTMREATGNGGGNGGVRELGREIAVIRPYLEILKVRMEERLATVIAVPDGLLSAEFPPMMVQTLVENAIKHGLEPKPEGGQLRVTAEIVHGKLQVTVADTGLGFGRAATAGTGVGLANIRERLQMLYGPKGVLTVAENPGGGTVVTITVPYKSLGGEAA